MILAIIVLTDPNVFGADRDRVCWRWTLDMFCWPDQLNPCSGSSERAMPNAAIPLRASWPGGVNRGEKRAQPSKSHCVIWIVHGEHGVETRSRFTLDPNSGRIPTLLNDEIPVVDSKHLDTNHCLKFAIFTPPSVGRG